MKKNFYLCYIIFLIVTSVSFGKEAFEKEFNFYSIYKKLQSQVLKNYFDAIKDKQNDFIKEYTKKLPQEKIKSLQEEINNIAHLKDSMIFYPQLLVKNKEFFYFLAIIFKNEYFIFKTPLDESNFRSGDIKSFILLPIKNSPSENTFFYFEQTIEDLRKNSGRINIIPKTVLQLQNELDSFKEASLFNRGSDNSNNSIIDPIISQTIINNLKLVESWFELKKISKEDYEKAIESAKKINRKTVQDYFK